MILVDKAKGINKAVNVGETIGIQRFIYGVYLKGTITGSIKLQKSGGEGVWEDVLDSSGNAVVLDNTHKSATVFNADYDLKAIDNTTAGNNFIVWIR